MTDSGRGAALEAIAEEIRVCTRCRLHETRAKTVPGEGNPETEVVVVGEGPGRDENQAGRPFVGASGRLLTELIESVGWRRDDVFITNVVKCWPPGNRDPQPDEIAACAPYLRRQLEVLDPAVVMTAGKHSLGVFMPGERIGRVHGTARPADPATGAHDALVFAMYHPAFALYDGSNRSTLATDMQRLPTTLLEARARREGSGDVSERGSATARAEAPTPPEAAATAEARADVPDVPTPDVPAPDAVSAADVPDEPAADDRLVEADREATLPTIAHLGPTAGQTGDPDTDQLTLF
ncbi:MAG TPA: uracil-DNA glycosylase [Patescibacteria group bacterium]|nr:uracil-DNA glycosylase [Patescibacteria group bacterium]